MTLVLFSVYNVLNHNIYGFYTKKFWLGGFPGGSVCKESSCNTGDPDSILGSGRSPVEGNGNPLQYSCLENPMGRGAWWLQSIESQEQDKSQGLNHNHLPHQGYHGDSDGKEYACIAGEPGSIPGSGRSLEKGMATHSSTLAWRIPWAGVWQALVNAVAKSQMRLSD